MNVFLVFFIRPKLIWTCLFTKVMYAALCMWRHLCLCTITTVFSITREESYELTSDANGKWRCSGGTSPFSLFSIFFFFFSDSNFCLFFFKWRVDITTIGGSDCCGFHPSVLLSSPLKLYFLILRAPLKNTTSVTKYPTGFSFKTLLAKYCFWDSGLRSGYVVVANIWMLKCLLENRTHSSAQVDGLTSRFLTEQLCVLQLDRKERSTGKLCMCWNPAAASDCTASAAAPAPRQCRSLGVGVERWGCRAPAVLSDGLFLFRLIHPKHHHVELCQGAVWYWAHQALLSRLLNTKGG